MKDPTAMLQQEMDRLIEVLRGPALSSLNVEERTSLRNRMRALRQRLSELEEHFLVVGLLGGTGVGKSTVMNALAGSKIASASHRRPHTDRVLIYRHEDSPPLPPLSLADIPWEERLHRADPMEQVLLCDLPDFDSLVGEHRDMVLGFLENLDLLVWVTSPEKYADARFYEFLKTASKARTHFIFLLNKADIFFENTDRKDPYRHMEEVAKGFRRLIREAGIPEPLLYVLSAGSIAAGTEVEPWNQFPPFKEHLFQRRTAKVIKEVKADNLKAEVEQIRSQLQREEETLGALEGLLDRAISELDSARNSWRGTVQNPVSLWLRGLSWEEVRPQRESQPPLVGPGFLLERVIGGPRQSAGGEDAAASLSRFAPPEDLRASFRKPLQQIEDRLIHGALRRDLPSGHRGHLSEVLDVEGRFEALGDRFRRIFAERAGDSRRTSFRISRFFQRLVYALIFLLLLLAIGGSLAWRGFLLDPGWTSAVDLVFSGVMRLFSAQGLAALGSYTLINLLLGLRFYRRHRDRLRRRAGKILDDLETNLLEAWDRTREELLGDLKTYREEIRAQRRVLSVPSGSR